LIPLAETRYAVAAPTRTVVCRSGVWAEDPRRVCLVSSRSGEPNRSVFSRLHVRSVRLRCWGALVRCFCLLVFPVVPLRSLLAFFLLPAPTEIVDCAEQLLRSAAARTGPWCLQSAWSSCCAVVRAVGAPWDPRKARDGNAAVVEHVGVDWVFGFYFVFWF